MKLRVLAKTVLLVPASLLLFGCRDARTADVTGFWRMQNFSRQYLPPEFAKLSPTLQVITNQTFIATDLPLAGDGAAGAQSRTFRGSWVLQREKGDDHLMLTGDGGSPTLSVVVDHGSKGHHLHYFVGQVDNGEAIQFERIQ